MNRIKYTFARVERVVNEDKKIFNVRDVYFYVEDDDENAIYRKSPCLTNLVQFPETYHLLGEAIGKAVIRSISKDLLTNKDIKEREMLIRGLDLMIDLSTNDLVVVKLEVVPDEGDLQLELNRAHNAYISLTRYETYNYFDRDYLNDAKERNEVDKNTTCDGNCEHCDDFDGCFPQPEEKVLKDKKPCQPHSHKEYKRPDGKATRGDNRNHKSSYSELEDLLYSYFENLFKI